MKIISIDYSLSSPALCIFDTNKEYKFENCLFFNRNDLKKTHGVHLGNIFIEGHKDYDSFQERYFNIAYWAFSKILKERVEKCYIEDYALGASKGLVFNIAENQGLLKHYLWKYNIPVIPVAPRQIKLKISGNGNAKKRDMEEVFKKRTCLNLRNILKLTDKQENPISDLIDAYSLGELAYGIENDNQHY